MKHADYSGQTGIFDPSKFGFDINLVALGGIGSAVALPLVKLGVRTTLHLWDFDDVEAHNVPAQLIYKLEDVGRPKVEAAAEFLRPFCDEACQIVIHNEAVTAETPLSGIVISGVDSMAARHAIWEAVEWNFEVPLYLDGRMGGEEIRLLTVLPCDPDSIEFYTNPANRFMVSDNETTEAPCAERTVIHPPVILAGMIIAQLTCFIRERKLEQQIDFQTRETQLLTSAMLRRQAAKHRARALAAQA